jgi:hypothetical protein
MHWENLHCCGTKPLRWRLVCHSCGSQAPDNAVGAVCDRDHCKDPDVHIHCLHHPCARCSDDHAALAVLFERPL